MIRYLFVYYPKKVYKSFLECMLPVYVLLLLIIASIKPVINGCGVLLVDCTCVFNIFNVGASSQWNLWDKFLF